MDCILGYHLNPLSCGIAKFNLALARQLGIQVMSLFDPSAGSARRPLLSIKLSEFTYNHGRELERLSRRASGDPILAGCSFMPMTRRDWSSA